LIKILVDIWGYDPIDTLDITVSKALQLLEAEHNENTEMERLRAQQPVM